MQFKIGSTLFLGGESKYKLSAPLQGLAAPAIRTGDGLYAGRDGGFVSGHYYGHRTLVLQGFYIGDNCEDAAELREVLFSLLRIRYNQPVIIYTANGNFYTEGVVSDVKADLESLTAGKYQISILCPDPILYSLGEGTTAADSWVTTKLTNSATTLVGNAGSVDAYPLITCVGGFSKITITNETTEKSMVLEMSASAGNTTVFDMSKRIITKNGELANANRTPESVWWSLIPGVNNIRVTPTSASSLTVTMQHRVGRAGI